VISRDGAASVVIRGVLCTPMNQPCVLCCALHTEQPHMWTLLCSAHRATSRVNFAVLCTPSNLTCELCCVWFSLIFLASLFHNCGTGHIGTSTSRDLTTIAWSGFRLDCAFLFKRGQLHGTGMIHWPQAWHQILTLVTSRTVFIKEMARNWVQLDLKIYGMFDIGSFLCTRVLQQTFLAFLTGISVAVYGS
jgi:hypothetical protein